MPKKSWINIDLKISVGFFSLEIGTVEEFPQGTIVVRLSWIPEGIKGLVSVKFMAWGVNIGLCKTVSTLMNMTEVVGKIGTAYKVA